MDPKPEQYGPFHWEPRPKADSALFKALQGVDWSVGSQPNDTPGGLLELLSEPDHDE